MSRAGRYAPIPTGPRSGGFRKSPKGGPAPQKNKRESAHRRIDPAEVAVFRMVSRARGNSDLGVIEAPQNVASGDGQHAEDTLPDGSRLRLGTGGRPCKCVIRCVVGSMFTRRRSLRV